MAPQHEELIRLQATALAQLQHVDLHTPMQQIRQVLDALLDVPTSARAANTAFSQQTSALLTVLMCDTQQLCTAIHNVMEHVSRAPSVSHAASRCAFSAVGE